MFPVLATIGNFPVSSFGLFLLLGIFFGAFSIWRIARSFDFDAEKVLDLIFLTLGAGFLFSRAGFVLFNLGVFDSLSKIFFLNKYPGLSFWSGLFGGLIFLSWIAKRNRVAFLQAADLALLGFFIAAFFAEIGCLLGGCGIGIETTSVFSVDQAGAIGKRLPVQIIEAVVYLGVFLVFWRKILKFHIQGSFFSRGLIVIGLVKLVSDFYKEPGQIFMIAGLGIKPETVFSILAILCGTYFHYRIYKKTPLQDLKTFLKFFVSRSMQKSVASKISRGWYNQKTNFTIRLGKGIKKLFRFLNVRSNPDSFK